jgi:hypothetical protein
MDLIDVYDLVTELISESKLNFIHSPKLIETIERADIFGEYEIHGILKSPNLNLDDKEYELAFHGVDTRSSNYFEIIKNIVKDGLKVGFNNNRTIKHGPYKGKIDKNIYSTSLFHNAAKYTCLDTYNTIKFGLMIIIAIPKTEINKTVTHASGYYGISQFKYDKIEELHPKCVFKLPAGGMTNNYDGCEVFKCECAFLNTDASKKYDRYSDQYFTQDYNKFKVVGLAVISLR